MQVQPGNASHIGQRQQQQDAFTLSDFADADFVAHGGYLAVLADGIGGLRYGAVAADIAAGEFVKHYLAKPATQAVEDALDAALDAANNAVLASAHWRNALQNMGSTLVAALVYQGHLRWRAVGDSHLYLCREGRLSQLNADHNFARQLQYQVNAGLLTQEEADQHPDRRALESFIGLQPLPEVERSIQPLPLKANDRLLLCSDGIDGVLSVDEIVACLALPPMPAAQQLCDSVLEKRQAGQDNLTAVVLGYELDAQASPPATTVKRSRNPWFLFASAILGAGLFLLLVYHGASSFWPGGI